MNPYRTAAIREIEKPSLFHRILRWFCSRGWHIGHRVKVLRGGDGPDEANYELHCYRCGAYIGDCTAPEFCGGGGGASKWPASNGGRGWLYGDGERSWEAPHQSNEKGK